MCEFFSFNTNGRKKIIYFLILTNFDSGYYVAKILVEDLEDQTRVPFLRGILIRSLQDAGELPAERHQTRLYCSPLARVLEQPVQLALAWALSAQARLPERAGIADSRGRRNLRR